MRQHTIAQAVGEPPKDEPFTAAEETARDAEEQAEIAAFFERSKSDKRHAFVAEGVRRIAAQVPDWDSVETIKTVAGLWPAISAAATPAQLLAKDIYVYVRDTVPAKLAAITTAAGLSAINPSLADPFGDGTAWPA